MLQRLRVQPCLAALPAADLIASGCRTCEGCEQGGAASEAGNVPKQHFAWEPTLLHLQLADAQRAQLFGVLWGRGVWAKTTMPMSIATELLERRLPCEAHIRLGCEELEASHAFCGFLRSRALLLREFRRAHYMLNHGSLHAVQSFEARHHEVYDMSHKMVRWPGPLC